MQRDINIINNKKRGNEIKIGDNFGKLTVTKDLGLFSRPNGKQANKYLCDCSCGTKNIEVWGVYLNTGEKQSCGCLRSIGEKEIRQLLDDYGILYYSQYSYKDLLSDKGNPLKFDFAFVNLNGEMILLEYQGDIHFEYRENGWNNKEHFEKRQESDNAKKKYCKDNKIKLYEITYKDNIESKLKEILLKEGIISE